MIRLSCCLVLVCVLKISQPITFLNLKHLTSWPLWHSECTFGNLLQSYYHLWSLYAEWVDKLHTSSRHGKIKLFVSICISCLLVDLSPTLTGFLSAKCFTVFSSELLRLSVCYLLLGRQHSSGFRASWLKTAAF